MQAYGTISTPLPPLEQFLYEHGDQLYRLALLLTADATRASHALHDTFRYVAKTQAPPFNLTKVVPLLIAAAQRQTTAPKAPWRTRLLRRSPPQPHPDELYRAILALPLEQRQIVGLHMLLDYDLPLVARTVDMPIEQVVWQLNKALTSLAPAASITLPDDVSTDQCAPIRRTLSLAPAHTPHPPEVRGHLATCRECRAFEQAWHGLVRHVESTLRGALREETLPPDLLDTLTDESHSSQLLRNPRLRGAIVPLLILALIGAIVLPGFFQRSTSQPMDTPVETDPQELIQQALANYGILPDGGGVWHGQWEITWYFSDGSLAPLRAEAWFDTRNPARHRLELTHSEGGAPYELQIGDGEVELWYALHPAYHGSLYGETRQITQPQLLRRAMDPEQQETARTDRLAAGAWYVGEAYLRQAAAADDVRTLGQQRDGEHTVQIISFSGISPLGRPPATPDAADSKIPIILTIDVDDGRLRQATELVHPSEEGPTSRVTWRLQHEEWVRADTEVAAAFDIEQAWTGKGEFSTQPRGISADSSLLLYDASAVEQPIRLLTFYDNLSLPNVPPAGSERALLVWPPPNLTYVGPGRWLSVVPSEVRASNIVSLDADDAEQMEIGDWQVQLHGSRAQRYRAIAQQVPRDDTTVIVKRVQIDASGYSRAELLAVIRSLKPFDVESLQAQDHLFTGADQGDTTARATLLNALDQSVNVHDEEIMYRRERRYNRHNPVTDTLTLSPYHPPPAMGLSETMIHEQWYQRTPTTATALEHSFHENTSLHSTNYSDSAGNWWYYLADIDLLITLQDAVGGVSPSLGEAAAMRMLSASADGLFVDYKPDGTRIIIQQEPIEQTDYAHLVQDRARSSPFFVPYLYDLQPMTVTTELTFSAEEGIPTYMRVTVVPDVTTELNQPVLIKEWELLEARPARPEDIPASFHSGEAPAAVLVEQMGPNSSLSIADETLDASEITPFVFASDSPLTLQAVNEEVSRLDVTDPRPYLESSIPSVLAQVFDYRDPNNADTQLLLFQGPAVPLRNFLQFESYPPSWNDPLWQQAEPLSLRVAGQDVTAWLMRSEQREPTHYWLVAEVDDILLIAEGSGDWFINTALPLLDTLQPSSSP